MNKSGYIFIETIIVLTVTMICLLSLYNGYSLVVKSSTNKKYYDNINDVYKANIVKKILKSNSNDLLINKDNCKNYMDMNCNLILSDLEIENVFITDDLTKIINSENKEYKNSLKKYLKTLDNDKKYIIISRKENNNMYYASLKLGDVNE